MILDAAAGIFVLAMAVAMLGLFWALLDDVFLADRRKAKAAEREQRTVETSAMHMLEERSIVLLERALVQDAEGVPFMTATERAHTEAVVAEYRQRHPKETP